MKICIFCVDLNVVYHKFGNKDKKLPNFVGKKVFFLFLKNYKITLKGDFRRKKQFLLVIKKKEEKILMNHKLFSLIQDF